MGLQHAPDSSAALRLEDLDYDLPPDRIAQHPAGERDASRLLGIARGCPGALEDLSFRDLPGRLTPDDLLVRNVTRVLPARLAGRTGPGGTPCEVLLVEPAGDGSWWALVRPGRRLRPGTELRLGDGTALRIVAADAAGRRRVAPPADADLGVIAASQGAMPLPPYIERPAEPSDAERYQTVYAAEDGSVAAPTAGLHFTPALLAALAARGVETADLVLHIGPGTFQPIRSADPRAHPMHAERFRIARTTWERIRAARGAGRRVVAVGTTVVRTLESLARWTDGDATDAIHVAEHGADLVGTTRLFVLPPFEFRIVGAMLTNFHLPRSSLLLLVDAFAGRETIRAAYAHAVAGRYRFFSYGDATWIA